MVRSLRYRHPVGAPACSPPGPSGSSPRCARVGEEPFPLAVSELVTVQGLQLTAQVGNEVGLLVDVQILIALLGEQMDEFPLQRRLALVAVRAVFHRLVGGDDGVFRCGDNDAVRERDRHSSFIKTLCFTVHAYVP